MNNYFGSRFFEYILFFDLPIGKLGDILGIVFKDLSFEKL